MFRDLRESTPEWLKTIRTKGADLCRREDWPGLHEARDELRRDGAMWPALWGPACAIAARRMGDPTASALLASLVAGGFHQPEIFEGEIEAAFGDDEDWPEIAARMAAMGSQVPIELTRWPTIPPAAPLQLFRLPPDRETLLRQRIPAARDTAWATAQHLLSWVTRRWAHANLHLSVDDAVTCLDRVDAGERFACVEYSIVLSQALNAVGIPARRLDLRQPNYHEGIGRGHVVSEAWIDELGQWVVLDGQNGFYWVDGAGPLGALELQARLVRGAGTPTVITPDAPPDAPATVDEPLTQSELDTWFSYFAFFTTTGATSAEAGFVPVFQREFIITTGTLLTDARLAYPDLGAVGIGVELKGDAPAIRMSTTHPYAEGFTVGADGSLVEASLAEPTWPLDLSPGEHWVEIAVKTRYGVGTPQILEYSVRADLE